MMRHRVTLELSETPTDILERELARACESARRCEAQGSWLHTWDSRASAIRAVLDARRGSYEMRSGGAARNDQAPRDERVAEGRDPDFPPVGLVRYELMTQMTGLEPRDEDRCCIRRVEVVAVCENRAEARQWMLDHPEAK